MACLWIEGSNLWFRDSPRFLVGELVRDYSGEGDPCLGQWSSALACGTEVVFLLSTVTCTGAKDQTDTPRRELLAVGARLLDKDPLCSLVHDGPLALAPQPHQSL